MPFHDMSRGFRPDRLVGLLLVLALHAIALWGLWQHRLFQTPKETMTLFVEFIAPPAPEKKEEGRTQASAATQAETHLETPAPADRRRDARRRADRLRRPAPAAIAGPRSGDRGTPDALARRPGGNVF